MSLHAFSRISEVKQMRKAQGYFVGGRRGFGFDVVDGIKVPNEAEQGLITEYWTNKNGTCSDGNGLNKPYYLPINLQQVMPNFRSKNPADREIRVSYEKLEGHQGKLVCRMPGDGRPGSRFRWEYEINLPTIPFDGKLIPIANQQSLYGIQAKRVTVRARLYVNDEKRLSLDDEAYPLHFKRLADAMFVNAIELTPQEMQ